MLARVLSSAVIGIDAYIVEVEVDISQGLPSFSTVGLPEGAVRESKERVKASIKNSGYQFREYEGGYEEFFEEFKRFFNEPRRFTYTPLISCRGYKPKTELHH